MANKRLKGNYYIPDQIKQKLQSDIDSGKGGKNRRRIIGYLNDGYITDREIAKLLYDYKQNQLGSGPELKIIEKLIKWVQREVKGKAEHIYRTKKSQTEIDPERSTGNKHKKTHFKWGDDTKPINFHNLVSIPKPEKMFEQGKPLLDYDQTEQIQTLLNHECSNIELTYNNLFEKYNLIKDILHEFINPKKIRQTKRQRIINWVEKKFNNAKIIENDKYPDYLFYLNNANKGNSLDVLCDYNKTTKTLTFSKNIPEEGWGCGMLCQTILKKIQLSINSISRNPSGADIKRWRYVLDNYKN